MHLRKQFSPPEGAAHPGKPYALQPSASWQTETIPSVGLSSTLLQDSVTRILLQADYEAAESAAIHFLCLCILAGCSRSTPAPTRPLAERTTALAAS